jgi:hypothetical protein
MDTSTLSAKHESPGVPASAFRVRTSALRLLSFFLFCLLSGLTSQAENLNVLDMGATPDGRALNTTIIQKAIDHITILETRCPVFIRLGNRARKYTPEAPQPAIGSLGNVSITNVVATTSSKTTSNITGMRGVYAENIYLGNIQITNKSSGTVEDAAIVVPEKDEGYPTSGMFGDVLPASAFFVRHVKNITFDNVRLIMENENVLPAFVLDDVQDVSIRYPQLRTSSKIELADQKDCQDVQIVNQ